MAPGGAWGRGGPRSVAAIVLATNFYYNSTFGVLGIVLPDVARDLGVSEAAAVWAVLLPLLVTAVLQPATGLLADMLGRKRIWMLGYAINLAGTTLAGCSSSLGMLLAGRLIQGLGSALDSPTGVAMILEAFGKENRAMVLGAYTASNTVGASVGLIAGGVIVQHFGWRMLFLWPIAPVAVMFLVAGWGLPESGGGLTLRVAAAKFDWAGTLVMAAAVSVELVGVNRASVVGWASPQVLAPLAASVPLACLFLSLEARRERNGLECVIRPSLFSLDTTLAIISSFARFVAYIGLFTAVPLFLRDFYHMDADHAAALVSVRPFLYGMSCLLAGRLVKSSGEVPIVLSGTLLTIVDKALFILMVAHAGLRADIWLLETLVVFQGFGNGFAETALKSFVIAGTPPDLTANMQGILNAVMVVAFMNGIDLAVTFCGTEAPGSGGGGAGGAGGQATSGYLTASVVFLCIFLVALALVLTIAARTWNTWGWRTGGGALQGKAKGLGGGGGGGGGYAYSPLESVSDLPPPGKMEAGGLELHEMEKGAAGSCIVSPAPRGHAGAEPA